ncbi:hypothetical protein [Siminovitchia fortis]|uniref:hypothetical protein n=1 Tax=Siminovitchia fortis TaxID=254758 RepID=UPI0011A5BF0B|nr:hypothetical protein [Siminovitchia fortis]
MNFTVEIKAPELANAINNLATALSGSQLHTGQAFKSEVIEKTFDDLYGEQSQQAAPNQAPVHQQPAPVQQPAPEAVPTATPQQQAPTQPTQEQPQAVPTSAPTYTMDQLAVAATQLMDAGKREDLLQLLSSFGVQALTALPQEQYGAFATKLRDLGAKI